MSARTSAGSLLLLIWKYLVSKRKSSEGPDRCVDHVHSTPAAADQNLKRTQCTVSSFDVVSSASCWQKSYNNGDMDSPRHRPGPLLSAVTWTKAWRLISWLVCPSPSQIKPLLFFLGIVSETIQPLNLFANWWQSGGAFILTNSSVCRRGAI